MYIFVAIIIGVSIVVAMVQNGALTEKIGYKNTTLVNFITGIMGTLTIFIMTRQSLTSFLDLANMKPLGYIGGIMGVIVVLLSNIVIRKIPVIESAMLAYVGQLACGLLIDVLLGTSLSNGKIIGCVLILTGVMFNTYADKKSGFATNSLNEFS